MRPTQQRHDLGQSLWLDNITRGLLTSGTLHRYIEEYSVTGLTSNPTIFDHAIRNSPTYDDAIRRKLKEGKTEEALFFELALEDLQHAADLFQPIYSVDHFGASAPEEVVMREYSFMVENVCARARALMRRQEEER